MTEKRENIMHTLWTLIETLKSDYYRWIDLSYELSPQTPHWRGFGEMTTAPIYDFSPTCMFHADHLDNLAHILMHLATFTKAHVVCMIYN